MPFYILKDGSEVLIDAVDFPEPSDSLLRTNPYTSTDPRYKKYLAMMKARYYKGLYKSAREALDRKDFEDKVGDLHDFLKDTNISWNEYLRERGLPVEIKNPVGRPKMEDHLKKVNPKTKRSTKMKILLSNAGITIAPDNTISGYDGFIFLPNGRIKFTGDKKFGIEAYVISTHQFIEDYC